jgi:hypothetical protein
MSAFLSKCRTRDGPSQNGIRILFEKTYFLRPESKLSLRMTVTMKREEYILET